MKYPIFAGDHPLTQKFGSTTFTGEPALFGYPHFHKGVDFSMPIGTPLYASEDGTCQNINDPSGAKIQKLVFPDNRCALYIHLNDYVASGQVKKGQLIGHSGNSGRSTGPHLHFELRTNKNDVNSCIDPLPYLNSLGGGEPMINDFDNEYGRWNKLFIQIRGREATRDEFRKNAVGLTWIRAMEILSDDAEADRATQAQAVGLAALAGQWVTRQQYADDLAKLQALYDERVADIQNLTTQTNDKNVELIDIKKQLTSQDAEIEQLKQQLASGGTTAPPDPIGADTRSLIQKIKDWIDKYILK